MREKSRTSSYTSYPTLILLVLLLLPLVLSHQLTFPFSLPFPTSLTIHQTFPLVYRRLSADQQTTIMQIRRLPMVSINTAPPDKREFLKPTVVADPAYEALCDAILRIEGTNPHIHDH